MVLPLLLGLAGSALGGTGALGAMGALGAGALGSGLGRFIETGDLGKGIETGLSGLGRYLNIESDSSRSWGGIQSQSQVRGGRFKNTKYISEILNNFIIKVNKLKLWNHNFNIH